MSEAGCRVLSLLWALCSSRISCASWLENWDGTPLHSASSGDTIPSRASFTRGWGTDSSWLKASSTTATAESSAAVFSDSFLAISTGFVTTSAMRLSLRNALQETRNNRTKAPLNSCITKLDPARVGREISDFISSSASCWMKCKTIGPTQAVEAFDNTWQSPGYQCNNHDASTWNICGLTKLVLEGQF